MDHLTTLSDPVHEPVQVPLLCERYVGLRGVTLDTYPLTKGCQDDESLINYMSDLSAPDVEAVAQEWLYFVLLSDLFVAVGVEFQSEDFTRQVGHIKLITTTKLPEYVHLWQTQAATGPQSSRDLACEHTRHLLTQTSLQLQRLSNRSFLASPVALSVIILCETLAKARSVIYRDSRDILWPRHNLPRLRMQEQGWCANRISMLYHTLNTACLYLASSLKDFSQPHRSHQACSEFHCKTNNIDRDTYRPQHVSPRCSCPEVGPDARDLQEAIDAGGYPLVRVVGLQADTGYLRLQTTPFTVHNRPNYVAISHVWSDGIGNLQANALPTCQLTRLSAMAGELYPSSDKPPFIWLDTLCVPYTNDSQNRRRTAIGRMQHTYQNAEKVLVLSSDLYNFDLPSGPEEALLRIQSTGWMRRLWTLQEGVLNQHLNFRFNDRSVALAELVHRIEDEPTSATSAVSSVAVQFAYDFTPVSQQGVFGIKALYNSLQWRNTSWASDEAICLSILLGLDTDRTMAAPDEDRMWLLLSMIEMLPSRMVFSPGKRLTKEGYTWAPRTTMNGVGWTIPLQADKPAMQSPLGLIVTWPGFFFTVRSTPCKDVCFFKVDGENTMYRVMNLGPEDGGESWEQKGPQSVDNPAIMIGTGLLEGMEDEGGAFVSIEEETTSGAYVARYISRVQIYKEDLGIPGLEAAMDMMWEREEARTDVTAVLGLAEPLPKTQIWCLK